MVRSSLRPAAASGLLAAVALFAAPSLTTITTTTAQSQQDSNCASFNSSSTAGILEGNLIAEPTYFGCGDDGFLVAVEASYFSSLGTLSWTCSGGETVGSFTSDSSAEGSVAFTVGIVEVQTRVTEGSLAFLSGMYFGGYDLDTTGENILFSWKGPFGQSDEGDVLRPDFAISTCGSGAFATGATVWSTSNFVYGVVLECAYVSATCAPPDYPADLLEDTSDAGTTDPSSYYEESTLPTTTITTPSPSMSTRAATDTPNFLEGTPPPIGTPSPSVGTVDITTDAPNPSVSPAPTTDSPSSSGGGTVTATDAPGASGATEVPAADTPSPSGSTGSGVDTPSPSESTESGVDTPSPSAGITSTRESSTSSGSSMVIVGVSVAGGLCLLAIGAGVAFGLYRRNERKARSPEKPRDTFGPPVPIVGAGAAGGGGVSSGGGAVAHASEGAPTSPRGPPPPYVEPTHYHDPPPPYA